jgi:hypothetical protein
MANLSLISFVHVEEVCHHRSNRWLLGSFGVIVTIPRRTLSKPPSQYSVMSCRAVKPVSINARRFFTDSFSAFPIGDTEIADSVFGEAVKAFAERLVVDFSPEIEQPLWSLFLSTMKQTASR